MILKTYYVYEVSPVALFESGRIIHGELWQQEM